MTRIALVDDQSIVRAGMRLILESEPGMQIVGEASNGAEALELVERTQIDVMLMDVRMPVMDGIEATRRICLSGERAPRVLMLTTFDQDEYVYDAIRAGASGFLLKDASPEQLVEAVSAIARGDGVLAPSVTRLIIEEVSRSRRRVTSEVAAGLDTLTEREVDVLKLMAKGLSNVEIASDLFLGEATVKTHVGRILAKLAVRDRVQAVVLAYESGLVSPGWAEDHPEG